MSTIYPTIKDSSNKVVKPILLLVFVIFSLFLSLPSSASDKQKLSHEQLTKKAYLITFVLKDIKTKSANLFTDNQSFSDGYLYADAMLNKAKVALGEGQLSEASELLEQAFINMTYVRSFMKKAPVSSDDKRRYYIKLVESVEQFIDALSEALVNKKDKSASENLVKAQKLKDLAANFQQQNNFVDANLNIELAYNMLVKTLSRIKDKQTAVVTLNFATAKDEYLYEIKQYNSFQMLLELRKTNVTLSDNTLKTMAKFIAKSTEYFNQAELLVAQLQYEDAIATLETANKNLKRALRVSGVNVY